MRKLALLLAAFLPIVCISQEVVSPIGGRKAKKLDATGQQKDANIDSTFQFSTDTLQLPVFDDFTKSHFQNYSASFTDPGVTSTLYYRLLDMSDNPLPANQTWTTNVTYIKYVNSSTGEETITNFPPTQINVADFSSYPVTYATATVYPAYFLTDTTDFPNPVDTTFLVPYEYGQDSARVFFANIQDANSYWTDNFVYHNYTLAKNPWSLGVATFDGLDENGYPYSINTTVSGVADYLTSKTIDLSGKTPGDQIWLSFLYQPQGLGDAPEAGDSLVLEFYAQSTGQWHHVWAENGAPVTEFQAVHIPVTNALWLTSGFRFRFKNYGQLSGSLDHFHLDYVNLRENSAATDSIFPDFAWVYPVGSLLKDYTSVPWDHYRNNPAGKMNDEALVAVRNTNYVAKNPAISRVDVTHAGSAPGTFILNSSEMTGGNIPPNYDAFTTYINYLDFTGGYEFDTSIPGDSVIFNVTGLATIQEPTYAENDTCHTTQVFADYYSYDDGTAEQAYGLNISQARLAYQFTPYEADSLIGVRICFVPTVTDATDEIFLLTVWADGGGVPGAVLYEDQFFDPRSPVYGDSVNFFQTYWLKDTMKLPINGRFYVGMRQIDPEVLNIGLDRNTSSQDKIFYSINGGSSWQSSSVNGSLMIRPIFSTPLNADLGLSEIALADWSVYPNPGNGIFAIRWNDMQQFSGATCFDMQGRQVSVVSGLNETLDLTDQPAGVYLLRESTTGSVKKVVRL